jgi:hypothetical protein
MPKLWSLRMMTRAWIRKGIHTAMPWTRTASTNRMRIAMRRRKMRTLGGGYDAAHSIDDVLGMHNSRVRVRIIGYTWKLFLHMVIARIIR